MLQSKGYYQISERRVVSWSKLLGTTIGLVYAVFQVQQTSLHRRACTQNWVQPGWCWTSHSVKLNPACPASKRNWPSFDCSLCVIPEPLQCRAEQDEQLVWGGAGACLEARSHAWNSDPNVTFYLDSVSSICLVFMRKLETTACKAGRRWTSECGCTGMSLLDFKQPASERGTFKETLLAVIMKLCLDVHCDGLPISSKWAETNECLEGRKSIQQLNVQKMVGKDGKCTRFAVCSIN